LCKISEFLERLQSSLSKVNEGTLFYTFIVLSIYLIGSFLANILASCMFFGKNMARLGLDFRGTLLNDIYSMYMTNLGLLPPIFESVVKNIFEKDLECAVSNFGTHLRKYRNLAAHQGLSEYTPKLGSEMLSRRLCQMSLFNILDDTPDNISPPIILLDFPPLAILTNVILSTFNDLRYSLTLFIIAI
jgi:hypothetical protein